MRDRVPDQVAEDLREAVRIRAQRARRRLDLVFAGPEQRQVPAQVVKEACLLMLGPTEGRRPKRTATGGRGSGGVSRAPSSGEHGGVPVELMEMKSGIHPEYVLSHVRC